MTTQMRKGFAMNDKKKIRILKNYVGKLIDRNQDDRKTLLNIGKDNLLDVLHLLRDEVWDDLHEKNDGQYMTRNKLLPLLDEVIECYGELS